MKTEILLAADPNAIRHASAVLRHSGLVAFPTDTVYGVGAMVFLAEAVERLYVVKGRSTDKAIAVLLGRSEDLDKVTQGLTPAAQKLAKKFWPGSLTLVVPKHPNLPKAVSSLETVGVRVPDHPVAQQLLVRTGPLAVTSANRSGEPSALTAAEVLAQLSGRIDLLLDGGHVPGGVPSTVVDCTTPIPCILREGPITGAEVEAALDEDALDAR
jgi:L-threonylcarbamoyladenylate synthase